MVTWYFTHSLRVMIIDFRDFIRENGIYASKKNFSVQKIFRYRRLYGLRLFFCTTRLAYNEALPLPSPILRSLRFSPFAFFPMHASEKNLLSESSRRVSNSGYRSIATAPYLTASVNRLVYGQLIHSLPTKPSLQMGMAVAVSRGICMDEIKCILTVFVTD
jgi:hypothetical protein